MTHHINDSAKFHPRWWLVLCAIALLGGCASTPLVELARPESSWQKRFEHPVSHHQMVGDDLLVVGTTRHLYGIEPQTGRQLWRLRNVNTNARDVIDLPGANHLLVSDAAGGAFDDRGTHLLAVSRTDGKIVWESPVLSGRLLQARVDFDQQRLFAVLVQNAHGDDRGLLHDILPDKGFMSGFDAEPRLAALNLRDGTVIWSQAFGSKVMMRPSQRLGAGGEGAAEDIRPFDLGLYHPPTLVGDKVCVTYDGLRCYKAANGAAVWSQSFEVVDGSLGLSYPDPVLRDRRLLAGDTEHIYAFDPVSGDRLWRSDDYGRVPELLDDDVILYGQVGGRYFDADDESWKAKGPFAVVAINRRNGNTLWERRLRRSISNLLIAGEFVYVADDEHLWALDRLDGTVGLREPHQLREPPNIIALNEPGDLVLISTSEAAGYGRISGQIRWYETHPAPQAGAWARFAAGLMSMTGNLLKLSSSLVSYGRGFLPPVPNITTGGRRIMSGRGVLRDSTGYLGDKLMDQGSAINEDQSFANLTGKTQYFVTRPEGYEVIALAAVNIETGATHRLTVLPTASPILVIDEVNGLAYQAGDSTLVAIPLGEEIKGSMDKPAEDSPLAAQP
ncbi:MAG: PQQ-binding-like beta-propeller repeat protein [Lysobacterales bacterium]